jgi:HD superfamily phosphohydrolase
MDYIVRDALMCGVKIGFDIHRVISSLTINRGRLVVKEKGVAAVEAYLLARYYMYWQVYLHKTTRILDMILVNCLKRARDLHRAGKLETIIPGFGYIFYANRFSIQEFLETDDVDFIYMVKKWQDHDDPILRDLARRYVSRDLFKKLDGIGRGQLARVRNRVKRAGYNTRYYLIVDNQKNVLYDFYNPGKTKDDNIYVLKGGRNIEFSRCSRIIKKLMGKREDTGYYLPDEVRRSFLRQ